MQFIKFLKKLFSSQETIRFTLTEQGSNSNTRVQAKKKGGARITSSTRDARIEAERNALIAMIKKNPFIHVIDNSMHRPYIFNLAGNLLSEMHTSLKELWELRDSNNSVTLQYCEFSYKNRKFTFTVEFRNKYTSDTITAWCPEIKGCVTQAISKRTALENLMWAIVESIQISVDHLDKGYLNQYHDWLPPYQKYNFDYDNIPVLQMINLLMKQGFNKVSFGPMHMIFVNQLTSDTFTLPYDKEITPVSYYIYKQALSKLSTPKL